MTNRKKVINDVKPHELAELFALPLQSAVKAQNLAIQETISFIEQFGLEEGRIATPFTLKAERMVEERKIDPETKLPETRLKAQPFEISIPLLALVQPPNIQLQEMNVEFGVDVIEMKAEPIKSTIIPSRILGTTLAPSLCLFSKSGQSNPGTMKVSMKIVREVPEGMARVGDILADLLSGQTIEEAPPEEAPEMDIERIEGIGHTYAKKLMDAGIKTTRDLLAVGSTPKGREDLAKETGISPKLILRWVNLVDLFRIKGIAEEYSDLLEEAGVDTVVELSKRNPENLYAKILEINEEKRLVRRPPTPKDVQEWVERAKKLPRKVEY